jgi:formate C-acetyltransferase
MARNLLEIAAMNERLVTEPPATFREACQWILWFQVTARMYNGSGSMGKLDVVLRPFYEADLAAGRLTDEEAVFHLACLLIRDNAYLQLGGPDERGADETSPLSFLILEAAHQLRTPVNVGVSVGANVDERLLRRGVEILLQDRLGVPKFLGVESTIRGAILSGLEPLDARRRAYSGCHWSAIPGREYAIMDCIKIEFGTLLDLALRELLADASTAPSVDALWSRFERLLREAVDVEAEAIDYHYEHMHRVYPELVLDLLCHGPIERGLDASHGGVDYYTFGVDGAALATVADSFAALEQRVEREKQMTWSELLTHLDQDWKGPDGERARLMMKSVARFGSGGSPADAWAERIAQTFTAFVSEKPTPRGFRMIPGLFSWANTISMGRALGATPNGRHAGAPISHGANPDPGFRHAGAPTALAAAVARVQPGRGNAAPLQMDLEPSLKGTAEDVDVVAGLIRGHFDLGGTQININLLSRAQLLEAHQDPSKYPDLIVRVTGFSAYFASLSPAYRQMVLDRLLSE